MNELRVLTRLGGTTEPKIDAIAADVNNAMNNGLGELDIKGNQLVDQVKNETAAMKDAIEAARFGVPAPSLASMSAASVDAGINVTVTATDATVESGNHKGVLATTKGVMVRYKEGGYPANKEDGTLAFIDEDLFNVDGSGNRVAKAKTHLVVGLTKDHTYYFSAFPYTPQGAHNERLGAGNVARCTFVLKGTLHVDIGVDNEYSPLGTITASLVPQNGGEAITRSRVGAGRVSFEDVLHGNYTLSFSPSNLYTKPQDQNVNISGGGVQTLSYKYVFIKKKLQDYGWKEIECFSTQGTANQLFSIGDTKDLKTGSETLTMQICGFNHDNISGGGKAGITFCTKNLMATKKKMQNSVTNGGGFKATLVHAWLNGEIYNGMSSELKTAIKTVNKLTAKDSFDTPILTESVKLFLLSGSEVASIVHDTENYNNEGNQYPIFTNNTTRIKKLSNGAGAAFQWVLRSPYKKSLSNAYLSVSELGALESNGSVNRDEAICFGFCI